MYLFDDPLLFHVPRVCKTDDPLPNPPGPW